ncbi:MAG: diguanylate cyclase [Fibromonadaceae bacterium]|jgi:diguanylate cyclase (GGDEF)-like protein|nr:diguanylate cyclase [Fibromonadaceae bacterium]
MNNTDNEKKRILIVDDDKSNILVLSHILKPVYSTLAAVNGQKAIEIAKKVIPDLILLDVVMPDMDGFEVLKELKRNDVTSEIPVMFITALDKSEDEEKGFTLGAADYITKPFSFPIVKARVKTQLKMVDYIREIKRFGITDPLTGLSNRRFLDERIKIEWSRAQREKEPLSVLMIDADKFKIYNDTYGHMQGDIHLKTIAKIFQNSVVRAGDFVARWGGEEFTVLLPNTDLEAAFNVGERIRINVKEETAETVSIGINSKIPTADDTIDDFIHKADEALYEAKRTGRDKVCSS